MIGTSFMKEFGSDLSFAKDSNRSEEHGSFLDGT